MKLFYQLDEQTQNKVIHYCANTVINDMLNNEVKLEAVEDNHELNLKIEEAIKQAQQIPELDKRAEFLLADEDVSKAIYDIAVEIAKTGYYHDDDEFVVYPNSIDEHGHDSDHICDHDHSHDDEDAPFLLEPAKPKKSDLN